jgi:two-component system chemotaxis response regulator CheY
MIFLDFINSVKELAGSKMPKILVNHHEMSLPVIMKAKRAGASGFLLKPFNRPTLLEKFEAFGLAA